jgi:hypothetical protein
VALFERQEDHVVDATAEPAAAYPFDAESKTMTVGFNDLYVVTTGGVDVFAMNLNDWEGAPPYYLSVEGREFALQPSNTYLVTGHGADLPAWLQAEEIEGHLTVLAERGGRYLVYSHDTTAVPEEDEEEAEGEEAAAE